MKTVRSLLAASALLLVPGAAMAAPNFIGPSGFILTPDATVTPAGCFNLGYHYLNIGTQRDRREGIGCPDVSTIAGNLGVANHFEIGGNWLEVNGVPQADAAWLNMKAEVLGPKSPIQLAGGVMDALDESDRGAYFAGTINVGHYVKNKLIPRSLRMGGGWGSGNVIDGAFANGSFLLGPNVEIMAEWIHHQDTRGLAPCLDGHVNAGVRFRPSKKLAGLCLDFGALGVDGNNVNFAGGLSYAFCMAKKHKPEPEGKGKESEPKGGVETPKQKSDASTSRFAARQSSRIAAVLFNDAR